MTRGVKEWRKRQLCCQEWGTNTPSRLHQYTWQKAKTNAIHDQGASTTFMSKQMAERLCLQGVIVPLSLKTFGPKQHLSQVMEVKVRIFDHLGRDMGILEAKVVPNFADIQAVGLSLIHI